MKMKSNFPASSLLALLAAAGPVTAQSYVYVHPGAPPTGRDFRQPPQTHGITWKGPAITPVQVRCWHAEPSAPNVPVGGSNEWQKIEAFARTPLPMNAQSEKDFRQKGTMGLSGGGAPTPLSDGDIPSGIFLSTKAHPVFKITKLAYPATQMQGLFSGPVVRGVRLDIEFLSTPNMGECYFYVAVWEAARSQ